MDSARRSTSIEDRREDAGDWASAQKTGESSNIGTIIKQSVRMSHLYFLLSSILFKRTLFKSCSRSRRSAAAKREESYANERAQKDQGLPEILFHPGFL
jgi:hypothetical protein